MNSLTLIIDNYDSFVYNIVQMVGELGSRPAVVRNDEITVSGIDRIRPERIIISPGPGTPEKREDAGISVDVVRELSHSYPLLGICMGHQIIGYAFGARIRRAKNIMHGKVGKIIVTANNEIFNGLPHEFMATRYHSLVVDNVPDPLIVTAVSAEDGEVMAISHKKLKVFGVQFHPESIGTSYGRMIISNFLGVKE
ncbi:MAG: anthranilate synthase component II [Nitrososphaeria archaeon]